MKHLDPKIKYLFFFQYFILYGFLFFIIVSVISLLFTLSTKTDEAAIFSIVISLIAGPLLSFLTSMLFANLAYKYYKYGLSHEGVKMERGVIYKRYSLTPYQKIQNIDITRGIFSRIFGLSELHIQTAGASGYYGAEIFIPGLKPSEAEKLREEILSKVKSSSSHGV